MTEYSYTKKAIIRELSEDSGTSITGLAKKLSNSRTTILSNIKWLEDNLGLSYTLELDTTKFGNLNTQISFIKFETKPSIQELKDAFKGSEGFIIFLAVLDGDADLILKTLSSSNADYMYWAVGIYLKLSRFKPIIKTCKVNEHILGFMPIPQAALEKIDPKQMNIDELDHKILLLLNADSRRTYNDIAKISKEDVETVRYRVRKLRESGLIKRYTAILKKLPPRYNLIFYYNSELTPRSIDIYTKNLDHYADVDGKLNLINTFLYVLSTNGAYNTMGIGTFENQEEANSKIIYWHMKELRQENIDIKYSRITNVIYGSLPIRSSDILKEIKEKKEELKSYKH